MKLEKKLDAVVSRCCCKRLARKLHPYFWLLSFLDQYFDGSFPQRVLPAVCYMGLGLFFSLPEFFPPFSLYGNSFYKAEEVSYHSGINSLKFYSLHYWHAPPGARGKEFLSYLIWFCLWAFVHANMFEYLKNVSGILALQIIKAKCQLSEVLQFFWHFWVWVNNWDIFIL